MKTWSKLPTFWYGKSPEIITSFLGGVEAGRSQAALRVLLALAAADRPAVSFNITASLSDLQDWTDLSRSMVLAGVRRAEEAGLVSYAPGKQASKSNFTLVNPSENAGGWAKLPILPVRERIPKISHRGDVALAALKIYLILVAARPNDNCVVSLRHETIRNRVGSQARHLRSGISLLANEGLVHVINGEDIAEDVAEADKSKKKYPVQRYQIVGALDAPRRWSEAVVAYDDVLARG